MDMRVRIGGLVLDNPVMTASGTYGYGDEYSEYHDPSRIGAVISKGLTRHPREGNPPPRLFETTAGLLNSVGLQNMGIDRFVGVKAVDLAARGLTIIANISGSYMEEFGELALICEQSRDIAAIEVNVSCPNVKKGGMAFGTDPRMIREITRLARDNTAKALIVKLSPNVTDISEMAVAACDGGADAVTVANTLLGMAIDINTGRPVMSNIFAGLSGPAVKPVIMRMVYQVKKRLPGMTVIASGGIKSWEDALESMFAGATAFQLGTAMFRDPGLPEEVLTGLEEYMRARNVNDMEEIIGAAHK